MTLELYGGKVRRNLEIEAASTPVRCSSGQGQALPGKRRQGKIKCIYLRKILLLGTPLIRLAALKYRNSRRRGAPSNEVMLLLCRTISLRGRISEKCRGKRKFRQGDGKILLDLYGLIERNRAARSSPLISYGINVVSVAGRWVR